MSLAELVLILVVGLFVFGPNKLPGLATKLGKLYLKISRMKTQWADFMYQQKQQFILEENLEKAKAAEAQSPQALTEDKTDLTSKPSPS